MKKIGILFLMAFALAGNVYAQDTNEKEAIKILEKARNRILEEDKARQEAKRLEAEQAEKDRAEQEKLFARKQRQGSNSEVATEAAPEAMKEEEKKPMTPLEKLQATRKEALEHLDFYERVVRSVAREEAEVKGYIEVTNSVEKK